MGGLKTTNDRVVDILVSAMQQQKKLIPSDLTGDMNFLDMGADSLTMAIMMAEIEEEFSIDFSDEELDFKDLLTIFNLSSYIERNRRRPI